jgi:hypothetical protein
MTLQAKGQIGLIDHWSKYVGSDVKCRWECESFSVCVKLLGVQLGRDPEEADDCSEWSVIVNSLEREYGLRFNDVWGRNGIYLFVMRMDLNGW